MKRVEDIDPVVVVYLHTSHHGLGGYSIKAHKWTESGYQWRRCMLTSERTVHMLKCIVREYVCCPLIHDSSLIHSFIHLTANFIEKLWITTTVKPGMYYTSINRGLVITFNKTIMPITAVVKINNQRKGMNDSLLISGGNVFYGGWWVLRKRNSIDQNHWRNPGYFCLWNPESRKILYFRNTAQGIRNSTNYWNPEFEFYRQILESRTWNLESTARKPESKTVLDSLAWGDSGSRCEHSIFWFVFILLQFGLPCLSKASGRARESKASLKLKLGETEAANKQTKHVLKQKHTRVMGWWKWKEEKDQSLLSTSPQFMIFFFQLLQLQLSAFLHIMAIFA